MSSASVTFKWPHPGNWVKLAGTFNSWQPQDMKKNPNGFWTLDLDVPLGHHEFKFVVDGHWVHDQHQPHKTNEMGSHNNFIDAEAKIEPVIIEENLEDKSISKVNGIDNHLENHQSVEEVCIEVERKFSVPDNFHEILIAKGFNCISNRERVIKDSYYDTPDYNLLRADHWLRKRNQEWELKYPLAPGKENELIGNTSYHETSNVSEIVKILTSIGVKPLGQDDLNELGSSGRLLCFAQLETKRWHYERDDQVNVVIDTTDWGFRVGEIEILVKHRDKVPQAIQKITETAKQLGLGTTPKGKIPIYLKQFNPGAYRILRELHPE